MPRWAGDAVWARSRKFGSVAEAASPRGPASLDASSDQGAVKSSKLKSALGIFDATQKEHGLTRKVVNGEEEGTVEE